MEEKQAVILRVDSPPACAVAELTTPSFLTVAVAFRGGPLERSGATGRPASSCASRTSGDQIRDAMGDAIALVCASSTPTRALT